MKNTAIIYLSSFILVLLSILPLVVFREGIENTTAEGQVAGQPSDFTGYVNQTNTRYNRNNQNNIPRRRNKGPTQ